MQISTSSFFRSQTETIAELKTQAARLQEQIATGTKVVVPSDDPVAFSEISTLGSRLARIGQYATTIETIRHRLAAEDIALGQVVNVLTRVQELVIAGANGSQSPADRAAMGEEAAGLGEQLLSLANTKDVDGSPLFGGYLAQHEAFTRDNAGKVSYRGDTNPITRDVSDDESMEISTSGADIFMSVNGANGAKTSVFELVTTAAEKLKNGLSPLAELNGLANALDRVGAFQARAGARLSRLDTLSETLDTEKLATKSRLSSLQDTDIDAAITELKQKLNSIEAAQASFVKIAELSLFNYLK